MRSHAGSAFADDCRSAARPQRPSDLALDRRYGLDAGAAELVFAGAGAALLRARYTMAATTPNSRTSSNVTFGARYVGREDAMRAW